MAKKLTDKQIAALELLTCGDGLTYTEICERIDINRKTLYRWINEPQFASFQEEWKKLNDERWMAIEDAARKSALALVLDCNPRIVEFVLKNAGYNPTTKVEAEVNNDVIINIGE